jgi:hypothetical protein
VIFKENNSTINYLKTIIYTFYLLKIKILIIIIKILIKIIIINLIILPLAVL